MDSIFNANIKHIGIKEVDGKFTKLKGYSKFLFFAHKIDKTWQIREFYTGRRLGQATTEVTAKKAAREYLNKWTHEEIEERIKNLEPVNELV